MLDLVGRTPMVRLRRIAGAAAGIADVACKLEGQNPAGSVKDRACLAMVEAAEREGRLKPGDTIVEPTSGNTGIGLALVAAVKGYRLILCMPDDASSEIVAANPRCFMPQQFDNPANPQAHRTGTALEILEDTNRAVDAFVSGVGTGGTITGVGEVLKQELPAIKIIAVEPASSQVLGGKAPAMHAIVKLVRVLLLAPVVIGLGVWYARKKREQQIAHVTKIGSLTTLFPPFILGFVLLALANTLHLIPDFTLHLKDSILWDAQDLKVVLAKLVTWLSTFLLTISMAGVGLGVDVRGIARVGLRSLYVGLAASVLLASFSFTLLKLVL